MSNKIMFRNDDSCIAIKDDKLYILSNHYKDISCRSITVMSGFQIELGRDINDIIQALKETRVPVFIKEVANNSILTYYQVIRLHTGKVDDKVVADITCKNNKIISIAFNRKLISDSDYRRYNQLSVVHQLSIPYDLYVSDCTTRWEQVRKILKSAINVVNPIEVKEKDLQLVAIVNEDNLKQKYTFISNKNNNNRYELISISLVE